MARRGRWFGFLLAAAVGCGQKPRPPDVAPITQEEQSLERDETALLTARGALQRERRELSDERAELAEKRRAVAPSDRTTSAALADQELALVKKEADLVEKEAGLSRKLDSLLGERAQLVQKATVQAAASGGADPVAHATARESAVAVREKDFARREADLATREAALAQRERELARREKETCGVAPPSVAARVEPQKGLKVGQHEVEPVYKKALQAMQERGLLAADLPGGGRLVDETRAAMQSGDFLRAKYAAEQLAAEIDAVQIDRAFIAGKFARVNAALKVKQLDKQADALLQDATAAYGDGRYAVANQKINRLYELLK